MLTKQSWNSRMMRTMALEDPWLQNSFSFWPLTNVLSLVKCLSWQVLYQMKFFILKGQTLQFKFIQTRYHSQLLTVSLSRRNLTFFFLFRSKPSTDWSSCSFEYFDMFLKRGLDACLFDKPSSVSSYVFGIFRQHSVRKHVKKGVLLFKQWKTCSMFI